MRRTIWILSRCNSSAPGAKSKRFSVRRAPWRLCGGQEGGKSASSASPAMPIPRFTCTAAQLRWVRYHLMPLHVADTAYMSFERGTLPAASQRGMGILGMKVLASAYNLRAFSVRNCLSYTLTLPVSAAVLGSPRRATGGQRPYCTEFQASFDGGDGRDPDTRLHAASGSHVRARARVLESQRPIAPGASRNSR